MLVQTLGTIRPRVALAVKEKAIKIDKKRPALQQTFHKNLPKKNYLNVTHQAHYFFQPLYVLFSDVPLLLQEVLLLLPKI